MIKCLVHFHIYTMDKYENIIEDGGILYNEDGILEIGDSKDIIKLCEGKDIRIEDGKGKFIFPGLINTHTHLYQTLLKGLGHNLNLEDWWTETIAPFGMALGIEEVENGVKHGICEALKSGVTTVTDFMQFHPIKGLSEIEIETALKIGIRLIYGRGYRDAGENIGVSKLNENLYNVFKEITFLKNKYEKNDDMIKIWLAPAAIWTFSEKGLEETRQFASETKTPIMMHMFETDFDNKICLDKFNKTAMDYYIDKGFLSSDILAVHSVTLSDEELEIYKKYGVKVSYNPVANMYLGSGIAPVVDMIEKGITVGIGTDGAASNNSNDMIETLKIGVLLQRTKYKKANCLSAYEILKMATIEGAKCIGMEEKIGSLEKGKRADLIIFNPNISFKTSPVHDGLASFVYSGDYKSIEKVIVNGKEVLKEGKVIFEDEEKIISDSISSIKTLNKKVKNKD